MLTGLFTAYASDDPDKLGWDFRVAYLPAAELVAEGRSPYPADPGDPQPGELTSYHYPPQLAVAITPLTRTSDDVAAVIAVLVSLAALMGALAVLGVRDVRCYAVVVIWAPGWNALEMANVSALLALLAGRGLAVPRHALATRGGARRGDLDEALPLAAARVGAGHAPRRPGCARRFFSERR